jgi:hypothetical protein
MLEERRRENDPPKKPSFAMVSSETRLWSRQSSPSHSSLHDKTFSAQWVFLLGRFNFVRERERERGREEIQEKSTLRKCGGKEGCLLTKCFFYIVCAYLTQMNQPLFI